MNDQDRTLILNNVLYIPDALERFFAPRVPLSRGHTIVMNSDSLTLRKKGTGEALFEAPYDPLTRLYWLTATILTHKDLERAETSARPKDIAVMSSTSSSDYDLWHRRFGHAGKKSIEELPGNVKGVPDRIITPAPLPPCDG